MRKILLLVALCPAIGGCAVDCASDWREVGLNDGRIGAESQIERYAASCGNLDRARYQDGWESGRAMRPRPVI